MRLTINIRQFKNILFLKATKVTGETLTSKSKEKEKEKRKRERDISIRSTWYATRFHLFILGHYSQLVPSTVSGSVADPENPD